MNPKTGKRWLAAAFLAVAFQWAGAKEKKTEEPRLVVVIAVDGLSWDTLWNDREVYKGGLARLLREGRVERACTYRHINTETAPGHAALSTGAPPRITGIVANSWYEPGPGGKPALIYSVAGAGMVGAQDAPMSPERLLVPTFADRLLAEDASSRVLSISGKDRAAILLAGRDRRHSVYWLEPATARFTSSSYYDGGTQWRKDASNVVSTFDAAHTLPALEKRYGSTWEPLSKTSASAPMLQALQIPILGPAFPHDLKVEKGFAYGFYMSPFSDELVADLALAFLSNPGVKLGRGPGTDALLVSFSGFDNIAHRYGPESEEALDVLARVDVQIGRLLEALDRERGRTVVALSADHGFLPLGQVRRTPASSMGAGPLPPRGRMELARFPAVLNESLREILCLDPKAEPVFALEKWNLYYDPRAFPAKTIEGACGPAGKKIGPREVDAVLSKAVSRAFGDAIDEVYVTADPKRWPASDPVTEFVRNSFRSGRSGDAILAPHRNEIVQWDPKSRGSDHGSHHDYDIHVPLVFWGAGVARGDVDAPTTPYDLAPTLASLVGVKLEDAVGNRLELGKPAPRR
jgi:hypothetical protein